MPKFASIAISVCILIAIGIVIMSSVDIASQMATWGNEAWGLLTKHIGKIAAGIVVLTVLAFVPYRKHLKLVVLYYFLTLGLLALPFISEPTLGSKRWIYIGNFSFQPSELAKISLILFISSYIYQNKENMSKFFKGFVIPILMVSPCFLLILLEPDLSTTAILMLVILLMLYSHGAKGVYILTCFLIIALVFYVSYTQGLFLKNYQISRFNMFVQGKLPEQVQKAIQSVKEGGLLGKGLGLGEVKITIPAVISDFVFAVIGEEMGLVGIIVTVALYWWLIRVLIKSVEKLSSDAFATAYITGFSCLIFLQVLVNLGVMVGFLPVTGVTLPFISHGGSSIIAFFAGLGIALNIVSSTGETS